MRISWLKHLVYVAVLCVVGFFVPSAYAQNSQLVGVITDPDGLSIGGAAVEVRNEGTGVFHQTTTTNSGEFTVPGLSSGSYTVRVTQRGFETAERKGITLFVATTTRLDLHLSIGQQTQTVSVDADTVLLQPDNAQLSTTVTREQYDELPLVQQGRIRSPTAFVYLAPSVQGNYNATGSENVAATNYISVNGSQMKQTEFYLSGLSSGQMANVGSYNESAPPVDAVQEFKMITTMVPADYGHTGAAAGIFAIRNGTNAWHGSVYEYFRNNVLDARSWGAVTPPNTKQNEFGATIGGPIILPKLYDGHNRSFFFFSYGGSRKAGMDTLKTSQIPTPAQIQGDFTGKNIIYDPATTRLNSAGTGYIRDPFPGNKIPISRMDPTAMKIASYYPAPNAPGTLNFRTYIGEKLLNPDVYTARVDHNLTQAQHLYFTLVQTRIPRYKPEGSGLPQPLSTVYNQFLRATTTRINHDWTLSSRAMNSLAIGYYRIFARTKDGGSEFSVPNQISASRPNITFSNGYASISTDNGQKTAEHQYLLGDTFYWTKGAHNFRFGGEFRRVHFNANAPNPGTNTLAMSNLETANPTSTGTTGDGFASFLLGQVHSGAVTAPAINGMRYSYGGLFAQDDWKISHTLTMNLGVRWEFETIPTDAHDRSSSVDLTLANPGAGNLPGALAFAGTGAGRTGSHSFASTKYASFSPRIGLSYQVNPQVVVRAGYGIFYTDLGWNFGTAIDNNGFTPAASFTSTNNGITPAFTLASGYPGSPSLQPSISPTLLNGQSANYRDRSIGNMPYIQQWNGSVQYSPAKSWMLEVAYVGNTGHRLLDSQFSNINQVDPKYLSLGSLLTVSASSAAAQAAGIKLPYAGFTGTVAQALRPYPQYMTLTSVSAKTAYSNYNAAQVIVNKTTSFGLRFSGNYTFAKNMGINSPSWMDSTTDSVLQNSFDPGAEYAISPIDVQHALVLNYSYELPFGRGKKFLSGGKFTNALVGGWKVSAIQRYQSGFPLPIKTSNSLPIFNRVMRPNVVPGVDRSTHLSANEYFPGSSRIINPNAFTQPDQYSFGNAKPTYSDIRAFPIYNEDLAFMKDTHITERVTWTIGANFFNAFNRHRFTSFNTTWSDAAFGQSTAVSAPRYVQINTRIKF
ncbi:TonB-dependent receptor [Edaphobacter albus]|uniref:TonB-dependent receptor n=1 Tax=Edaphobacter sp. 4G125 TaxID=2763071 RepID=UPI0016448892|nr:TonB-dependent receptor [Edaphobacter sp. 4G125]QNI37684.1 TonB-dependent receptor [Edaphobacter sp. 4G125]